MSKLRPVIPALIAGAVLALLVTAGQCTRLAMHRAETADLDPSKANSMPNGLVEAQRMDERFPEATTLIKSGVRTVILEEGDGDPVKAGARLTVNYRGMLWDGTEFDSSYERDGPYAFRLATGQVIRGWDLGIAEMRPGEKRRLIIPYSLAYGDRGRPPVIPPRAPLIFEIELVSVE